MKEKRDHITNVFLKIGLELFSVFKDPRIAVAISEEEKSNHIPK